MEAWSSVFWDPAHRSIVVPLEAMTPPAGASAVRYAARLMDGSRRLLGEIRIREGFRTSTELPFFAVPDVGEMVIEASVQHEDGSEGPRSECRYVAENWSDVPDNDVEVDLVCVDHPSGTPIIAARASQGAAAVRAVVDPTLAQSASSGVAVTLRRGEDRVGPVIALRREAAPLEVFAASYETRSRSVLAQTHRELFTTGTKTVADLRVRMPGVTAADHLSPMLAFGARARRRGANGAAIGLFESHPLTVGAGAEATISAHCGAPELLSWLFVARRDRARSFPCGDGDAAAVSAFRWFGDVAVYDKAASFAIEQELAELGLFETPDPYGQIGPSAPLRSALSALRQEEMQIGADNAPSDAYRVIDLAARLGMDAGSVEGRLRGANLIQALHWPGAMTRAYAALEKAPPPSAPIESARDLAIWVASAESGRSFEQLASLTPASYDVDAIAWSQLKTRRPLTAFHVG